MLARGRNRLANAISADHSHREYSSVQNAIVLRPILFIAAAVSVLLTHMTLAAPEANQRALLVRRVLDLCRSELQPKVIADMLGSVPGSPRQVMEGRTDYDLAKSDLIAEGTIIIARFGDFAKAITGRNGWIAVEFEPAPSLELTLQDLEPLLLDFPYMMTLQMAHFPDRQLRVRMVEHRFRVPAGILIVEVSPQEEVAAGTRVARHPVHSITLTTDPTKFADLEKAPTLRALRALAQKQK